MNTAVVRRTCSVCVMDEIGPGIRFDDSGQCNCCRDAQARMPHEWWPGAEGARRLDAMAAVLKSQGRGRPYDAMIGLSGGIDSAYLAHVAVRQLGLRVLAVHVDGGWNSEPAVRNIESVVRSLDLDLFTHVVEWQEMRDLQLAFLRASVLNQDIPQDHAFFSTLYRTARRFGIRSFLSGVNFATECVVPPGFGFPYSDDVHIRAIHKRFGAGPLGAYPIMSFREFLLVTRIRKSVAVYKPLNFMPYNKDEALATLRRDYGWRDYGSKHSESRFTKFYQDIFLPRKFGFDKRRLHLSSLIVSGQMDREHALAELQAPVSTPDQARRDIRFVAKKLGIAASELEDILAAEPVAHEQYPNQQRWVRTLSTMRGQARRVLGGLRRVGGD